MSVGLWVEIPPPLSVWSLFVLPLLFGFPLGTVVFSVCYCESMCMFVTWSGPSLGCTPASYILCRLR